MKLFYWSPFLSNIATVDSVINSINSLKRYGRRDKYRTFLIDASGEWEQKFEKILGINIIKLYKKKYYKFLPKGNFFKSRFSQLTIFICNFNPLRKLIIKEKPDFLIAHLIISLPFDSSIILSSSMTKTLWHITTTIEVSPIWKKKITRMR